MASKSGIQPYSNQEIIPSSELPKFTEALATMDSLERTLEPIAREARELKIVDKATRERAGILIAQIKEADGSGEDTMSPYKKILKKCQDYIQTRYKRVGNRVEEIKGTLTPKMAEWDRAEERAAQAERDRIAQEKQAALDREAEEKRREDEKLAVELRKARVAEIRADLKAGKITLAQSKKLLEQAGAKEEAAKAQAVLDEESAKQNAVKVAESVEVKPNVPTVAGNIRRVNWKFRIKNPQHVKVQYLCPDEVKIGARVRELKDPKRAEEEIGGIEVYEDRSY